MHIRTSRTSCLHQTPSMVVEHLEGCMLRGLIPGPTYRSTYRTEACRHPADLLSAWAFGQKFLENPSLESPSVVRGPRHIHVVHLWSPLEHEPFGYSLDCRAYQKWRRASCGGSTDSEDRQVARSPFDQPGTKPQADVVTTPHDRFTAWRRSTILGLLSHYGTLLAHTADVTRRCPSALRQRNEAARWKAFYF